MTALLINIAYAVAAGLFIFGLKLLSQVERARLGNLISASGMALAIAVTLLDDRVGGYLWIALSAVAGGLIGGLAAGWVQMTAMPQLVALFNGFGGLASLLVALTQHPSIRASGAAVGDVAVGAATGDAAVGADILVPVALAIAIGGLTFSGSLVAYGKLAERIATRPLMLPGQMYWTGLLALAMLAAMAAVVVMSGDPRLIWGTVALALVLGLALVLPIGGADMPVVISLLNSYSGLAACAAGFAIANNLLIVAGALVGASGIILTNVMCKGMNRSLLNVLFAGMGATAGSAGAQSGEMGEVRPVSVRDAWQILEAAQSVVVVPGYGMAVAQAQHAVRELCELMAENGADVRYAIHPVAGRMPGHMNVLLAEANVPYEQLVEPQDVNPTMAVVDICIVVGANDVVNPAAREQQSSPIYGMPIVEAERARTVFVLKRSMASGFAGVDNPLFFRSNTRMLFGDAKETLTAVAAEFKS